MDMDTAMGMDIIIIILIMVIIIFMKKRKKDKRRNEIYEMIIGINKVQTKLIIYACYRLLVKI